MFVTIAVAIKVNGQWFLPFEQYKHLGSEMIPLVPHEIRGGYNIEATHHLHFHYILERDNVTVSLPREVAVLTEFEIPEEYINRYKYREDSSSDNIRDYIKAAKEYLNIEIRYQIEYAGWYKRPEREQANSVSPPPNKEVLNDKRE